MHSRLAVNAFSGETYPHHKAFFDFSPFEGQLPPDDTMVDFMGVRLPAAQYCNHIYAGQLLAHAIRTRQCALHEKLHKQPAGATHVPVRVRTSWPVISEEYFEYVDVLTSVSEYIKEVGSAPTRPYTFIELGAGYGHWTLAAHAALKQRYSTRTPAHRYLMVDVVDSLKATVMEMSAQNGISPGSASFHVGYIVGSEARQLSTEATAENARYQSSVFSEGWGLGNGTAVETASMVTLHQLFAKYAMPCLIDMLDVDIQGSEFEIFDSQTVAMLTRRCRRVHIGIHSTNATQNEAILQVFATHGWEVSWALVPDDHFKKTYQPTWIPPTLTPWGYIGMGDGIMAFTNHRAKC